MTTPEIVGNAGAFDVDAVRAWIAHDPDPTTREQLSALLRDALAGDVAAVREIQDCFAGTLKFGTAGLRGSLGPGPNRMNRAVVIRAAAGLSAFLKNQVGSGFSVVVGFDARHGSAAFAADTAAVVVAGGGRAILAPQAFPTPITAFALNYLGADAAVVVTASHNPAQDNGYKVYLGGRVVTDSGQGAQIIPPYDAQIFREIQAVGAANEVARAESGWETLDSAVVEAYIERVTSLVPSIPQRPAGGLAPGGEALDAPDGALPSSPLMEGGHLPQGADVPEVGCAVSSPVTAEEVARRNLRIVVTSMHGVGGDLMSEVLRRCGFSDVHVVAEQHQPDPDFPTVPFPNPEEAGVLDLAYNLAARVGADLILANDPDADRCSAAVPDASVSGGWRQLTGDQVGSLLGEQAAHMHVARHNAGDGATGGLSTARSSSGGAAGDGAGAGETVRGVLANSIVSSRMLARIAEHYGLEYRATLTGFKWISRVEHLIFGYEEALGYCVDPVAIRDKDGISACLRMAVLAAELKARGRTLADALDDLYARYGVYATSPVTIRVEDLSIIARGMENLRQHGIASLAGSPVVSVVDLAAGWRDLPPTNGIMFLTEAGDRVIARPSGTEPKLKCYCEVIIPVEGAYGGEGALGAEGGSGFHVDEGAAGQPVVDPVAAAKAVAAARLEEIKADVRAALGV